ncbi:MAG TPA: tetratricopeptide repeat protein [Chromatiaceae bacterium]|nr:tetratricopeptide repeat protein [Chromatiaceae bacterium]
MVHQMGYVGNRCGPRCVLYPELHTRWAWALKEQGRIGDAVMHLQAAIKVKPDYSRAYAELADLYAETGQRELAKETLEEGLKNKPNSRLLKRRLKRLE